MTDIDEIRRANLRLLEDESGSLTAAAAVVGMSPAQFSNLREGAKDSKTGKPRGMRKETARRIERAFQKPPGWLDVDHSKLSRTSVTTDFQLSSEEQSLLRLYRAATEAGRQNLMRIAEAEARFADLDLLPSGQKRA